MSLTIHCGGMQVGLDTLKFSGGELQVRLRDRPVSFNNMTWIVAKLNSSDAVMELLLATDALRRDYGPRALNIGVTIPYFPYARQDRVCAPGEALSLKVMCDLINAQNYDSVYVWDAHSDVTPALLHRSYNIPASDFVKRFASKDMVMVAPDAGAIKRVSECAKAVGAEMVRADKSRNPATGEITGTLVYSEHIGKRDFLIVDDICDGGRTFIELAKKLRPLTDGKVLLYVTHGIFSQGMSCFLGLIDDVYVANPIGNVVDAVDGLATGQTLTVHKL